MKTQLYVIWQLINKDLLEIFRNKRALISGLLLPALFIPFLFIFQNLINPQTLEKKTEIVIYDYRDVYSPLISIDQISNNKNFLVKKISKNEKTNFDHPFDINIIIHNNQNLKNNINIFYNSLEQKSVNAYLQIMNIFLMNASQDIIFEFTDLNTESNQAKLPETSDTSPLREYPWLLLMFGFSGAAFVACEIITGEKERHTLETLFAMQIPRNIILYAKFLSVLLFAFFNLIVNLLIMLISIGVIYKNVSYYHVFEIFELLIVLFPALLLLSSILLHLSLRAKSIHEARSHESIFFLIFSLAIISFSFVNINPERFLFFIPFINSILLIKNPKDALTFINLFIYFFSYAYLSFLIINANRKYIQTDEVLFLNNQDTAKTKTNITNSLPLFISAILYLLMQTLGRNLLLGEVKHGILLSQLYIFFIPALFMLILSKKDHKWVTFRSKISFKHLFYTLFISFLLFIILNIIQQFLYKNFFPNVLKSDSQQDLIKNAGLLVNLLYLCLIPAICEELLFRAYIFNSFRKLSTKKAIIMSALIFMFFHQNYAEYAALFTLGIWFAFIVYKTGSIYPAMFAHFLNNAFVEISNHYKIQIFKAEIFSNQIMYMILIGSIFFLLIFLKLFNAKPIDHQASL